MDDKYIRAMEEGYVANKEGKVLADNPYPQTPERWSEYEYWDMGWYDYDYELAEGWQSTETEGWPDE